MKPSEVSYVVRSEKALPVYVLYDLQQSEHTNNFRLGLAKPFLIVLSKWGGSMKNSRDRPSLE